MTISVRVLTPPAVEPVTLTQVYDHLRLTPSDGSPPTHPHDDLLRTYISTARAEAEDTTHRAFVQRRLLMTTNTWPGAAYRGDSNFGYYRDSAPLCDYIELLRPPVTNVVSVGFYDSDGVLRTVSADYYYVSDDDVPRLYFTTGYSFTGIGTSSDALRIEYLAGYAPVNGDYTAGIPAEAKVAILQGVELLYNPMTPQERTALERSRDILLSALTVQSIA